MKTATARVNKTASLTVRTRLVTEPEPGSIYIGRPGRGEDGYYGNPHAVGRYCPDCKIIHLDAPSAVAAFRETFKKRIETDGMFERRVRELRGRALFCPGKCASKGTACHGAVYVEWLES